jgi:two-component system LytT family response regulator
MKIRTLIVDDEQLARQRVRLLLGEEPDVEVIGESEDGFEAVDQIQATRPDLVFLDVQMPDMDGFEVLRRVPQSLECGIPVVIFTTAYDQHALRAFEVNALDYLLKPFKPTRFKEAVQRARDLIANKPALPPVGFSRSWVKRRHPALRGVSSLDWLSKLQARLPLWSWTRSRPSRPPENTL